MSGHGGIAAVVLAAGASTRMAPRNKLLVPDAAGVAMAGRVVRACLASRADEVLVVLGHQAETVGAAIREAAHGPRLRFVVAERSGEGLSASLSAGLAALGGQVAAAIICLGDMPLVGADTMDEMMAAWCPDAGRAIIVPSHAGRRGNPVLWDRRFFAAMMALQGDSGARRLLTGNAAVVHEIAVASASVLVDFDTLESLEGKQAVLF